MKKSLAILLSVLMTMGLFTVPSMAKQQDPRELAFQTWNATALAEAGTAVGTKNSHGYPVFTTFYETIGRRSTGSSDMFIHGVTIPGELNGERTIFNGQQYTLIIRLFAGDSIDIGTVCSFALLYGIRADGVDDKISYAISNSDYEATPTQVDETYGYEYKEFSIPFTLENDIYDEEELKGMQFHFRASSDDVNVCVYSIEVLDMNEIVLNKVEGEQFASIPGVQGTYENIYSTPDFPSGVVSYSGVDAGCLPSRGEPYSLYNGDGLNRAQNEKYLMIDGLGTELQEGNYSFSFVQSSVFSLGVKRIYYTVTDVTADKVVATLDVDRNMVNETVGYDTGIFETRSVPFTVDSSSAGHRFTFQVYIYNQTDYKLRSASLNLIVDSDTTAPDDAQAVINTITNLDITNAQAVADARTAYDALSTLGQAWVGSDLANKLATYEKAQTDAIAVNEAITGLGNKDELTDINYVEKAEALEAVETLYRDFVKVNGQEIADKLINTQTLTDYRVAYDAAEGAAEEKVKQAAIQVVVDAINAIGAVDEIDENNIEAKQVLVDVAEAAANDLASTYGADVFTSVSNYNIIAEAKAKIDEILAVPEYTLGKVNDDDDINASDALMALQHSVKLITLEDNVFKAADVDGSETVDATDALYILQYSVNLIEKFPIEK